LRQKCSQARVVTYEVINMLKQTAALALLLLLCGGAHTKPLPSLVPPGWTLEARDKEARTRRFVSPDGRASFSTRQTRANRTDLRGDIDRIATRAGEQITYLKRGASWVAVSGYRDGDIFYRKSNLACGGSRWNQVELVYPQDMKRAMDAPVTRIAHGMTNYSADCN
jgi:hypothetical protein